MKIAVLLTCFNRREKTLECLHRLKQQKLPPGVTLHIYLTDDGSTDGTGNAVRQMYPSVRVFEGTGSLFWAGGMRYTWKKALQSKSDFYLLLNDDTSLMENAIEVLLRHIQFTDMPAICIGSTVDQRTGKTSYGGSKLTSKRKWKSTLVDAPEDFRRCDFGNANIMLVPKAIVEKIGILSDQYTHSLADYDYTLKARHAGYPIFIAPGFLGACIDDHGNNWKTTNTSLRERIAYLMSPKGLAYKEYLKFIKDHFPSSYTSAFIKLWMKTFFPFIWDNFKKG